MPTVFIDTNIIINENFFRSAAAQAFLKACSILNIEVVIPDIVYDEVIGNFPKKLKERVNAYEKAQRELIKLVEIDFNKIDLEDEVSAYEDWLNDLVETDGVTLAPYPEIPAKELVEKSYERKKPFKDNGEGHKDYIVWKTIRTHIENQQTALPNLLLTNNTKDFGAKVENDAHILHPDLANQIEEDAKRPKLYTSLKSVFDEELAPNLEGMSLEDIPNIDAQEITTLTEKFLLDDLPQHTAFGFEDVPFGNEVSITAVGETTISEVNLTKVDDEVVINVTGNVEIEVFGFVDKYAYYSDSDLDNVSVVDPDWNDHVMAVSTDVETAFELSIYYSLETNSVIGHKISLPQEIEDEWPYK
ncbi:MAG: DUF4935 domain-containing protein [Roseitalea sp.]|nr:DUF4935 domain-containing protein [Roseitalea sp.]MBO6952778.1 DUF4935 domain-containing protein [Rhizobiaceae bacterium]MBO6592735.1 DUF4935 domain-containing protein [Roseitalea sp.]MBO6600522.1 DUF4935 domain-containing protein [Roseitalea sp.]MBO6612936.1 DUF4935 domain-containing protein [Roseitalea sp.]